MAENWNDSCSAQGPMTGEGCTVQKGPHAEHISTSKWWPDLRASTDPKEDIVTERWPNLEDKFS